jgi:hypothetical protein
MLGLVQCSQKGCVSQGMISAKFLHLPVTNEGIL